MKRSLCLLSLLLVFVLRVHAQADSIRYTIYFNTGVHSLSAADKQALKNIMDSLHADRIMITGGADSRGTNIFNQHLSQHRAASVKSFLIDAGQPASYISVTGAGEESPVASNETDEGRRLNRRAEIIFIQFRSSPPEPTPSPEGDINELYLLLKQPAQSFCIDLTRDTLLVGKRGTIVHYKANMIKRDDLSCHCFTLTLNEYFDKNDFILNNLTTTSDGELLESGGMIKLDGFCDGKRYTLKPGEFFTVMVPTDTILPGMKLLSANRERQADYLNWKLDNDNPDPDTFDLDKMLLTCRFRPGKTPPCPFFFCRVSVFFSRIFRKRYQTGTDLEVNAAGKHEKALLAKYELQGEDLAIALEKSKENTGKDALKYYMYKNATWDYRNIDRYARGIRNVINFIVENKPDSETDVKIIYKQRMSVVPPAERSNSYLFKQVDDNSDVWIVGLRYTSAKDIYVALKELNTRQKRTQLDFQKVTADELKELLKKVNDRF